MSVGWNSPTLCLGFHSRIFMSKENIIENIRAHKAKVLTNILNRMGIKTIIKTFDYVKDYDCYNAFDSQEFPLFYISRELYESLGED